MTETPQTPPPSYAVPPPPMSPADEKLWATLVHIAGIFLYWVAPLIGYLVLKDRGPFVRWHTRQALNFQITLAIAYLGGAFLSLLLIGYPVLLGAGVLQIVFSIIAAVAAQRGEFYRIPVAIEFIK